MKIKFGIRYLILPITIAIFLLIPEHIVWGGQSYQTVPTIGPTKTPTRTRTLSTTQPSNTQTPLAISTSTSVLISPVTATATFTAEATQKQVSKTSNPEKTELIRATDEPSQPESTSMVLLPVVSNGDSAPVEQSNQDDKTPIPAFVFPTVVVLLFVIIYLITRLTMKKSLDEIKPK